MSKPDLNGPWRIANDQLILRVHLTPKANQDCIGGLRETADGLAVKARVRAAPENGKANAALEMAVAAWLGLSNRCVAVTAGSKSRLKALTISGDVAALCVLIAAKLAAPQGR